MTARHRTSVVGAARSDGPPSARTRRAPGTRVLPQATVTRLADCLRVLGSLADDGVRTVSSDALAVAAGMGSATLRKDLSLLGSNGVRGVGYDVVRLRACIELALGVDAGHRVVIVGAGNLGTALANYDEIHRRGFTLVGVFDHSPSRIGTAVGSESHVVRPMTDLAAVCRAADATVAVLAVPAAAAQEVADALVVAGVRSILNFANTAPIVPPTVEVRTVDVALELQMLSFRGAVSAS